MRKAVSLPEEVLSELYRCFRCGLCRSACPTFAVKGSEGWNARGRLMMARYMAEGLLEPDEAFLDRLFSCNSCGACEVVCPAGVKVADALRAVREALLGAGISPPGEVAELAKAILEHGNPWSKEVARRPTDEKKPILVFTGCVASELEPGIVKAVEKVLEASGLSYSVLEGPCCGFPLFKMGLREEARRAAEALAGELKAAGPKLVITPCPGCTEMLERYFPALTGLKVQVEHATVFFRRLLREGRLVLKRKVELKAAYHDPCVLARSLGIYEAPRELLWQSGLVLAEMEANRQMTGCCGYGQLGFLTYPDLAEAMAKRRVEEALRTGADVLVTACPSCLHAFSEAVKEVARSLAVSDITEVLAELV